MDAITQTAPQRAAAAERPSFYTFDGEAWTPTAISRSPWNPHATNGISIAGLLMHLAEQVETPAPMTPVHATIDILRAVPFGPCTTRAEVTRPGKKMQMVETSLLTNGETVARARVLRAREADSPILDAPIDYPTPEAAEGAPSHFPENHHLGLVIETRMVAGGTPGANKGAIWARFGDLAPGIPIQGVVQAAMLSDFGGGLARVVDTSQFSFANLDISVHLARRPVGEWMLVESHCLLQGKGVGVSNMILADRHGQFGRAHQSLFIDAV